ncbi:MAG: delta-60 repeat domain-containing protein [Pyrinomonadaceae bacterium]
MKYFGSGLRFRFKRTAATFFLCLSLVFPCFAALTLDPTFDGDGKLTIAVPDSNQQFTSQAFRVFVQPSGRILVGGTFTRRTADGHLTGIAWTGLTSGGGLDPAFDFEGIVEDWRSDGSMSLNDAVMYPDGTTLRLSGLFRLPVGSRQISTVRLTPDGVIDGVFGQNAATNLAPCGGFCTTSAIQIAARGDGKVLAFIVDQGYFLYRLNSNGTRDTTFGSNGIVELTFNKFSVTNFVEMVPLSDGKTLLVGGIPGGNEFFLARLTESGNWDKLFGRAGFLRVRFGDGLTGSVAKALLQPDGKILLSGAVTSGDSDAWLARFRSNGRPDTTFGNNGVVINDFAPAATDVATSIALSPDGKIRLAGYLGSPANFLVARLSANGSFEESTTFPFTANEYAEAADVALQADGKIVVVGRTKHPNPATTTGSVFAVARLTE